MAEIILGNGKNIGNSFLLFQKFFFQWPFSLKVRLMSSRLNPLPADKFYSFNLKEFANGNFKFDKNGRKLSKRVENTVGKKRNLSLRAISLFPHSVFKRLVSQGHQKVSLCGNELSIPSKLVMRLRKQPFENILGKGENVTSISYFSQNVFDQYDSRIKVKFHVLNTLNFSPANAPFWIWLKFSTCCIEVIKNIKMTP